RPRETQQPLGRVDPQAARAAQLTDTGSGRDRVLQLRRVGDRAEVLSGTERLCRHSRRLRWRVYDPSAVTERQRNGTADKIAAVAFDEPYERKASDERSDDRQIAAFRGAQFRALD